MKAYLNGQIIPAADCRLPIYDTGIVFGAAVTDLVRTFNGKLFRLEDHVRRLYASAKCARIKPPILEERTCAIAGDLADQNYRETGELSLVFYLTAGALAVYAGGPVELTPTFAMHTFPLPYHLWKNLFTTGVHCVTPTIRHLPPQVLSAQIKHRNRLHLWIGDHEAKQADPSAMPLYLDVHGHLTETNTTN